MDERAIGMLPTLVEALRRMNVPVGPLRRPYLKGLIAQLALESWAPTPEELDQFKSYINFRIFHDCYYEREQMLIREMSRDWTPAAYGVTTRIFIKDETGWRYRLDLDPGLSPAAETLVLAMNAAESDCIAEWEEWKAVDPEVFGCSKSDAQNVTP